MFRAGTNFVRVDAYPTADGKPVMDLKQEDFELSEDGVPQKVETFEHVVIQAPTVLDRARAPEPNTVAQSREMVAESKARLFVLFLDTYHISRDGAMNSRAALTRFLYGALGPDDLIAVTSPELPVGAVTFARRTESIEAILERVPGGGAAAAPSPSTTRSRNSTCAVTRWGSGTPGECRGPRAS